MKSFIQYSNDTHFPIQNLPYGIFKPKPDGAARVGVAIGNFILDLSVIEDNGLLKNSSSEKNLFNRSSLNLFMSQDKKVWKEIRTQLQSLLSEENATLRYNKELRQEAFIPMDDAIMCLPVEIR
jgi:fumarylacetoacetase